MPRSKRPSVEEASVFSSAEQQERRRKPRSDGLPYPKRKMRDVPSRIPQSHCPYPNCNFRSFWSSALPAHRKLHERNGEPKPLACNYPKCAFRADRIDLLNRHKTQHEIKECKIPIFQCSFVGCPFGSNSLIIVTDHEKQPHEGSAQKRVSMRSRKHLIVSKNDLKKNKQGNRHSRTEKDRKYKCSKCDYRGKWMCEVRRHMDVHSKKKSFRCTYPGCKFRANTNFKLVYHLKRHKCSFVCSFENCGYKTVSSTHLELHESRHKPLKDRHKIFSCTFPGCDYTTLSSSHLFRHAKTHDPERPIFNCPFCPRTYRTMDGLRRHSKVRHTEEVGAEPLRCSFPNCGYKTDEMKALIRHEDCHRRELAKPYACTVCKKRFNTRYYIGKHMELHGGTIDGDSNSDFGDSQGETDRPDEKYYQDKELKFVPGTLQPAESSEVLENATQQLNLHPDRVDAMAPEASQLDGLNTESELYATINSGVGENEEDFAPEDLEKSQKMCKDTSRKVSLPLSCTTCGFVGSSKLTTLKHIVTHKRVTVDLFRL